jgi:hypothetical protein
MVKGETIMPVPQGDITTSEILIPDAIVEADAEEATEEYLPEEEVEK